MLPNLLSPIYIFLRKKTPWTWRPYVRGNYNQLRKFFCYGHTNIFSALDIETTSFCNLKCSYCPNANIDRGRHFMEEKLFRKIIDELAEINFKGRVSPHFYGEPLCDDRLPELLTYARQKLPQADIVIHTNGILLTKEKFDQLKLTGISGLVVTCHLEVTKPQLKKLLDSLSSAEKKIIRVLDIDRTPLFNRGGLIEVDRPNYFKKCYYVSDEVAVTYQGNLVCTNDYLEKHVFGNLNKEKLMDIWHKPEFVKFRQNVRKGKFDLEICQKCSGNRND